MAEVLELSKVASLRQLNKGELAEFFGVSPQALDGWIRRGCPAVSRGQPGKPWRFDAMEVARWKFSGAADTNGDVDPDLMIPQDRKAWYESETKRRALQVMDRELIPLAEVERVVSTAFSAIVQGLRGLPDSIERRTGCAPEVVAAIEVALDAEMDALASRLEMLGPTDIPDE